MVDDWSISISRCFLSYDGAQAECPVVACCAKEIILVVCEIGISQPLILWERFQTIGIVESAVRYADAYALALVACLVKRK